MIGESSDNYEWDNYREDPSFTFDPEKDSSQERVEETTVHPAGRVSSTDEQFLDRGLPPVIRPFVFDYNQDNQYSVWPPRNLSSEPGLFFEESLLPRELLVSIEEEGIDDNVFLEEDSNTTEETMPPKAPAQIYATLKKKTEEFDNIKKVVDELGGVPPEETLQELSDTNKAIRKLAAELKDNDPNVKDTYPDVGTLRDRVQLELMKLQKMKENARNPLATDSRQEAQEDQVNSAVSALSTEFSTWEEELSSIEIKLQTNFNNTPEPNSVEVADTNKLLNNLQAVEESAKPIYIKLVVEATKISEETKRTEKLKVVKTSWSTLQRKVSQLTRQGQEYVSKFTPPTPEPTQPTPVQATQASVQTRTKNNLEKIPLPIFSGTKAEYLKFKQKFKDHVTYDTEKEKLMVLQSKCLSQEEDRRIVANEITLENCWKKLDQEYGDIDTLVAEIFSNWTELKPPKTNKEFVEFVKVIDYGVSTLESLGHGKDIDSSHMSVMLEKKLSEDLRTRFCRLYSSDDSPDKNRMSSLMQFLQKEKRTAQLSLSSYSSTKKSNENTTSASATGLGHGDGGNNRGRGGGARGRGRGGHDRGAGGRNDRNQGGGYNSRGGGYSRGGRGGGNDQANRGGYQGKRGEPSKKCLFCDGDHATSKCGNLRDQNNKKTELLGLAFSFRGLFSGDFALSSSPGLLGFPRSEQDCTSFQKLLLRSGSQRE